jgi:hypothetical protein|tara:strand:+ start:1020 stop:1670 length:651 start_codon:yes stop_codon:yes gene_type:complete
VDLCIKRVPELRSFRLLHREFPFRARVVFQINRVNAARRKTLFRARAVHLAFVMFAVSGESARAGSRVYISLCVHGFRRESRVVYRLRVVSRWHHGFRRESSFVVEPFIHTRVADVICNIVPARVPPHASVVRALPAQAGYVVVVHLDVVVSVVRITGVRAGIRARRTGRGAVHVFVILSIFKSRAFKRELFKSAALARKVLRVALGFLGCGVYVG